MTGGEALPPEKRRLVAELYWSGGLIVCLFGVAAFLAGSPIALAGQIVVPGMLSLSFSMFLSWTADLEEQEVEKV